MSKYPFQCNRCGIFCGNRLFNFRYHRNCKGQMKDDAYFADQVIMAKNFVHSGIEFFHSEIVGEKKTDLLPLPLRQLTVSQFEKVRDTPPHMRKMSDIFEISTRFGEFWIPNGQRFNPNQISK